MNTFGLIDSRSPKPAVQSYTFSTWRRETVRRESLLAHHCQLFPRTQCSGPEAITSKVILLWSLPSSQPPTKLMFMLPACCTLSCTLSAGLLFIGCLFEGLYWQSTQKLGSTFLILRIPLQICLLLTAICFIVDALGYTYVSLYHLCKLCPGDFIIRPQWPWYRLKQVVFL